MKKHALSAVVLSAFLLLMGLVQTVRAESELDFKLVNKTGYDIKEVYIGPSTSEDWGSNVLKDGLKDGQSADITFHPKATAEKWDLKIVWAEEGTGVQWLGYKLKEINTITLYYDKATDKTSAKTD